MKRYIDGFVLPVPRTQLSEYEAIAKIASAVWKEHGALDYWECVGDDLETSCSRTFLDMTNATDDEVVIFAWATFGSREERDSANEKIMADPRMVDVINRANAIIDSNRMAHGGFIELVSGSRGG